MPPTMIKSIKLLISILLLSVQIIAQDNSNSLSSSPYSLFGLGIANDISTGKINGLGKYGFAMPSNTFINNSNPSSFGSIPLNAFLFDFGFKAQTETLYEGSSQESKITSNFSNVAIAFPLSKKSGIGLTLIPFTSVGYNIIGIETNIEGSNETFFSDVIGSGGINDLKINYGYSLSEKLRLGISGSVLFGQITQTENNFIINDVITIADDDNYSGFRVGVGFQYDISNKFSIGGIANFPTKLNSSQTSVITQSFQNDITLENDLDDFKLPLEIGFGIYSKYNEYFKFNIDYKKSFWDETKQSDLTGDFVDQDFLSFGVEYTPRKAGFKFWRNVEYRAGFNYDTGNLEISNERITNYAFNLGLGIPLKRETNSMLNLSYSYGQKGQITNGLILENYHLISINISLEGIWFKKRKIN